MLSRRAAKFSKVAILASRWNREARVKIQCRKAEAWYFLVGGPEARSGTCPQGRGHVEKGNATCPFLLEQGRAGAEGR